MHNTTSQKFHITVPITGYTLRKNTDGTKEHVIAGTDLDLTGEQDFLGLVTNVSVWVRNDLCCSRAVGVAFTAVSIGEVVSLRATSTDLPSNAVDYAGEHFTWQP